MHKSINGVILTNEKGNLSNRHAYSASGFVGKSVDINKCDTKIAMTLTGKKGKPHTFVVKGNMRRIYAAVHKSAGFIRRDLVKAAIARSYAIKKDLDKTIRSQKCNKPNKSD